jgi:hypothetical protein
LKYSTHSSLMPSCSMSWKSWGQLL